MNTQQNPHRRPKLGSLSASALAALLALFAGAPVAARDIPVQNNTESSAASNASGGNTSTASSPSSRGGSRTSSSSNGGQRSREGRGDSSRHGDSSRRGDSSRHGDSSRRGDSYHRGDSGRHSGPIIRHRPYRGSYGYGSWGGYGTWGWGGWWPGWYPGWGGPTVIIETDGYGYRGNQSGALDLDLSPEKAQVFVDGNYIGVADDYDGFPTFLWLERGTYDVAFYLPGYQTIVRQYTVRPGAIIDVEDHMVPGESIPPQELMRPKSTERRDARIERNIEQEAEVDRQEREAEEAVESGTRTRSQDGVGRLYLSLWPADAAIYLDGHFLGTAEEIGQLSAGLVIEPGEHRLEVVRPGYATVHRTLTVPNGERIEVKFDLEKN